MLSNDFLESKHSYRVSIADMGTFLKECEAEGLKWLHGNFTKTTDFNPFKYYEGEKTKYLQPIMEIDNANFVYVRCHFGKLDWSFHFDWYMQPLREWRGIQ